MGIVDVDLGSLVGGVGEILDSLSTSEEEKLEISLKLKKLELDLKLAQMEEQNKIDEQTTKRWELDKEHIITRLVRPMIVIWIAVLLTAIILTDGNVGEYTIKQAYIPLIETLATTIFVSYFGSRGAEKITKALKERDYDRTINEAIGKTRGNFSPFEQNGTLFDDALWGSNTNKT